MTSVTGEHETGAGALDQKQRRILSSIQAELRYNVSQGTYGHDNGSHPG